jgi:hypothetical protein
MRVIIKINQRTKRGIVEVTLHKDESSTDTIAESNTGEMVYQRLAAILTSDERGGTDTYGNPMLTRQIQFVTKSEI